MNPVLLHHFSRGKKRGVVPKAHLSVRVPNVRATHDQARPGNDTERQLTSPIIPLRKRKLPVLTHTMQAGEKDTIESCPSKSPRNAKRLSPSFSALSHRNERRECVEQPEVAGDKVLPDSSTVRVAEPEDVAERAQDTAAADEVQPVKVSKRITLPELQSQRGVRDPSARQGRSSPSNAIRENDVDVERSGDDVEEADGIHEDGTNEGNPVNFSAVAENESEYNEEYEYEVAEEEGVDAGPGIGTLTQLQPVDLESLLKNQENVLKERNKELFHHRSDIIRSPRERGDSAALITVHSLQRKGSDEPQTDSPRRRWREMVDDALARDPGYFSSNRARMKEASASVGKGSAAYPGLKVNRRNCLDLDTIYIMRYRTKELMSVSSGSSFKLLQTIVGQFLRWCISSKRTPKEDGWKKKALFTQFGKENLVQVFINHFISTSAPSTVASKCNALQIVAKCAALQFSTQRAQVRIGRVSLYLKTAFNAAKCSYREKARQRQGTDERIQKQTIVTVEQTQKRVNLACAVLGDIMDSFPVLSKKKGQPKAMKMFEDSPSLVDKWCLNFLGLVALSGGGQRPQAYARLKCPARTVIDEAYHVEGSGEDTFSLQTFREKMARALDMPDVVFPWTYFSFFAFQVDFICPVLIGKRRTEPSDIFLDNDPLLLHSRTGEYMTPGNISTSIRRYMVSVEPRLTNVTAMTLRASYATSMLHNYPQGVFEEEGLPEEQFLELVAKQMNTSVEQLRNTYMSAYSKDFKQAMRLFTRHFTVTMNEKDNELDDYVEESPVDYTARIPRDQIPYIPKSATRVRNKTKFQVGRSHTERDEESEDEEEFERGVMFPEEIEETQ